MTKIMLSAAITATGSIISLMGRARAKSHSGSGLGFGIDDHMLRDVGLTRFDVDFFR